VSGSQFVSVAEHVIGFIYEKKLFTLNAKYLHKITWQNVEETGEVEDIYAVVH